jgi:hypothetical protein
LFGGAQSRPVGIEPTFRDALALHVDRSPRQDGRSQARPCYEAAAIPFK